MRHHLMIEKFICLGGLNDPIQREYLAQQIVLKYADLLVARPAMK